MDINKLSDGFLGRINPRILNWAFKYIKAIPSVAKAIEKEFDEMMVDLERSVKPYKDSFATYTRQEPQPR